MRKSSWIHIRRENVLGNYKQIADYGLIGDQRTCALVGIDGSIDWLCFPQFDSPSVFGALLDRRIGGTFQLLPDYDSFESLQYYDGPTNILITEFRSEEGSARVTDFMPCFKVGAITISSGEVHRRVTCLDGSFKFDVAVRPRFNYGKVIPDVRQVNGVGYAFFSSDPSIRQEFSLLTPLPFENDHEGGGIITKLRMTATRQGDGNGSSDKTAVRGAQPAPTGPIQQTDMVIRYGPSASFKTFEAHTDQKLRDTLEHWRHWIGRCTYTGPWREDVQRSALTLALLVYSQTGAILAAPTTSLPEEVGGVRNWDYRYSWIRDSTFVLWAFDSLGLDAVEGPYLDWLTSAFYLTAANVQVVLGINGERDLREEELTWLEGYRNSRPVRVGNAAYHQFQLDVYGILLDALYFSHLRVKHIDRRVYENLVRPLVSSVEANWEKPDRGIWEVRGEREHFVYSKMWCWVAMDRAVRIATEINEHSDVERWSGLRDRIRRTIIERGWSEKLGTFVRSFNSETLDAANLLLPQVHFISAKDPKMRGTIEQTMKKLMRGKKFVYRYLDEDGLPGNEGAFLMCSFWLANCLTLSGRLEEAHELLDELVNCSTRLGLFSEELDPRDDSLLGNYPQAFTHMAFIVSAVNLEAARRKRERRSDRRRRKEGEPLRAQGMGQPSEDS